MHSLAAAIDWHLRRLPLPALTLLVLLQRTPVVRLLAHAEAVLAGPPLGQVLRATALVATALGAVDTLAGATEFFGTPESPASATVGESFSAGFSIIGAPAPTRSYTIADLPPGLSVPGANFNGSRYTLNADFGTITGTPTTAGSYAVEITAWEFSNAGGRSQTYFYDIVVSGGVTVTAPSINAHPSSQTVTEGGSVTFSVGASGTEPFGYQWFKDGSPLSGATGSSYSINPVQLGHAGSYAVLVSNSAGAATSNAASLSVNPLVVAPSITSHPAAQTVNVGTQVTFSVSASGTTPFNYQWFKDGSPLSGATSASYTITSAQTTHAGSYVVTVGNTAGTATSNGAALTVNKLAQSITFAGPSNQGFGFATLTLSATASSGLAPTFALVSGPATLSGATLTLTGIGTVTVRAEQAGNSTYAAATAVTRSFTVSANYDYWLSQHFTSGEISTGIVTAPSAIAAADGVANLVKYALGLAAKTPAPAANLPAAGASGGNWTCTFTRPSGQTDITVTVEASTDLVTWSASGVTLTLTGTSGGTDTWTATRSQTGAPNLFFRVKATRP